MSAQALKKQMPESMEPPPAGPGSDIQAENILLVDDLPANLLVYKAILEELNQNLVIAHSGEEALKLVLRQDFAVILLDVNMPGMDGFETASLIRRRKKSARTPIIFMTAFTDEVSMSQGYASGAVDYLPSPIVPEVLKAKVRVFIELSQMRRQAALQAEEGARREAAEESARKSAFLARVSGSLARAQSPVELMQVLVQLSGLPLAEVSIVLFKSENGATSSDWSQIGMVADTGEEIPPLALPQFPWLEKAIAEATLSGQLQFLEEIPSVQPVQKGPPVLPPSGSLLVLPLAVQGQPRGIFLLARKHSSKPYQQDDICLAGELAYRAGVALENVMLLERIREADRRKDEFLGMLAHELRNPLGPIYNATHLLKLFGPPDPRLSDLRDIIDRQAKHMGRLIDDLLDATRLAHGKILLRKERCDLSKIVRQTVEDYRALLEASCLRLELETPSQPVWVEGDPTRLVQAIGNLLHNAHKFTNPGGVIIIRLRAEADDRGAVISVKDTGIGIEPKMLACVFDVFRQADQGLDRSRGGLGLGLALVKGLIQLHGGEVSVVSHGLGKGAEFSIRLPIKDAHDHNGSPAVSLDIPDARKYRILMIEDNRDAAESARQLLLYEGHDVQTVTSPFAGLEAAHCFRPQIIFCDIGLPGMDGYQIVRTIRQDPELASAYVIALTGYGRTEDQQRAFEAGFDLHLIKPIDYTNLCKALAMADAKLTATAEIRMVGRMSA